MATGISNDALLTLFYVNVIFQVRNSGMESKVLSDMLSSLQNEIGFSRLSQQSQHLLLQKNESDIISYVSAVAPHPLSRRSVVTCMAW